MEDPSSNLMTVSNKKLKQIVNNSANNLKYNPKNNPNKNNPHSPQNLFNKKYN